MATQDRVVFGEEFESNGDFDIHPLAEIFPAMSADELEVFSEDLQKNGQLEPIALGVDDRIIDGRNRYFALKALNHSVKYVKVTGSKKRLEAFVLSRNLYRRQLTKSQRALASLKIREIYEVDAREAQAHGQTSPGSSLPAKMQKVKKRQSLETSARAAKVMGVSKRLVYAMQKIVTGGVPEMQIAIAAGDLTMAEANLLLTLDPSEQKEIIGADKNVQKVRLKELHLEKKEVSRKKELKTSEWKKFELRSGCLLFALDVENRCLKWGLEHSKIYQNILLELWATPTELPQEEESEEIDGVSESEEIDGVSESDVTEEEDEESLEIETPRFEKTINEEIESDVVAEEDPLSLEKVETTLESSEVDPHFEQTITEEIECDAAKEEDPLSLEKVETTLESPEVDPHFEQIIHEETECDAAKEEDPLSLEKVEMTLESSEVDPRFEQIIHEEEEDPLSLEKVEMTLESSEVDPRFEQIIHEEEEDPLSLEKVETTLESSEVDPHFEQIIHEETECNAAKEEDPLSLEKVEMTLESSEVDPHFEQTITEEIECDVAAEEDPLSLEKVETASEGLDLTEESPEVETSRFEQTITEEIERYCQKTTKCLTSIQVALEVIEMNGLDLKISSWRDIDCLVGWRLVLASLRKKAGQGALPREDTAFLNVAWSLYREARLEILQRNIEPN